VFEIWAAVLRRGGNLFVDPEIPPANYYAYTPVWAVLLRVYDLIATASGTPMHFVLRAALTLADVGNACLIGVIAHRASGWSWHRGFATYFLNPVSILLVGFHGQVEPLAALPLLGAIVLSRAGAAAVHRRAEWLLGTASLVLKHNLAFLVWTLYWFAFPPLARVVALGLSAVVFAATFLPYLIVSPGAVIHNVLGHAGLPGLYGFSSFAPLWICVPLFFIVMTSLPLAAQAWGLDVPRAMRLSAIAFMAFTYGIGEQYFVIPILFGAALGGRWFWGYTAAVSLFLLSSFENVNILPLPRVWNAVWVVALAWTASEVISAVRIKINPGIEGAIRTRVEPPEPD